MKYIDYNKKVSKPFLERVRRDKREYWKYSRGMSLVEMIIYLSLMVLLLGVIVNTVLVLTTHYRAVRNTREIEDSATAVIDNLSRQIKNADEYIAASSTFQTSPSRIALVDRDYTTGNSTTTEFYVSNGKVMIAENGIELGPLTKESLVVVGFILKPITTSRSTAIKIELSMQSDQAAPSIISKNFYTTVVMRGSY